jgi:hypothetical protein
MAKYLFERVIQWLLFVVTLIYVVTGLEVTHFRIIEPVPFGLLNKNVSFATHDNLLIPFAVLLVLHVTLKPVKQLYKKVSREE